MSIGKVAAMNVLTAVATLAIVAIWLGDGRFPRRDLARARPVATAPAVPPVEPPAIPDEVFRRADADEQVNIRVYASVNRSVVNISTAAEGSGLLGDEASSGTGSGFVIDKQGTSSRITTSSRGPTPSRSRSPTARPMTPEVVGRDASNDVAVLGSAPRPIGSSRSRSGIRPGSWWARKSSRSATRSDSNGR